MAYTTIKKPSDYFNTVLYTGTGSSQNITGVGFQPDWTWIKIRSQAYSHTVWDLVRGAGQRLIINATDSEETQTNDMSAFLSDGFSLGTGNITNQSSETYASWNWLASNTTASNTDGSITSTVSANTTSGFSIVSYTGTGSNATVGHGLGAVPKMIITKNRDNGTNNWTSYHVSLGNTGRIRLNLTDAAQTGQTNWNSTTPTSSVFSLGTNGDVNGSGTNVIAYCFAEVKGFSKIGSYTGNGNADGPFVYTGFKPAWVMWKKYNNIEDWELADNKRLGYNPSNYKLVPNSTSIESTSIRLDFLSNGFKIRSLGGPINASGDSYIYMAFAEEPLVGDNPATAR